MSCFTARMRHMSVSAGTLLWTALLACYLQQTNSTPIDDDPSLPKSVEDSNRQVFSDLDKRAWHKSLPLLNKRAWQNLQGGWGKRFDTNSGQYFPPEKRGWQSLQSGWGKRNSVQDEAYALRQLGALLEQEDQNAEYDADYNLEDNETSPEEKRSWKSLSGGGWGKRSDWGNFRGSWGKRDPAWTNLKGIWGKRGY